MTDRVGRWNRAPIRGGDPAPYHPGPVDEADPTGERHAFDQDAALTPIFTTLHPVPEPASPFRDGLRPRHDDPVRPLRNDAVTRFRNDPLTAPLPVVPAYGDEPADMDEPAYDAWSPGGAGGGPVDPYAPASFAPPPSASSDVTTWWSVPLGGAQAVDHSDRGRPLYPGPSYDDAGYGDGGYGGGVYPDARHDDGGYEDPGYAAPVRYDIPRRQPRYADPMSYDPVTDRGRHHRLAPAGW